MSPNTAALLSSILDGHFAQIDRLRFSTGGINYP